MYFDYINIVGIGVDNLFYFGWGLCDYMIIIDFWYVIESNLIFIGGGFDLLFGMDMVWNNILFLNVRFGLIWWLLVFMSMIVMFFIISLDVMKVVGVKVGFVFI